MSKQIRKMSHEGGFSLVEMLIVMAISGLIIAAIFAVITQTISVNAANTSHMEAIKQVENAIHWLDRDSQQAFRNEIVINNPTLNFPLTLTWTKFGTGDKYTVIYTFDEAAGVLQRSQSVNSGTPSLTHIANNISSADYSFNGTILEFELTSQVNGFKPASESRVLYVMPRVGD